MPNPSPSAKDTPLRLTRRSLFAGTASLAATALASAALAQPTQADAEFTVLGRRFEQALAAHEAAQRHFNECENRFLAECPDPPKALTPAGPLGHWLKHDWMYWTARDLRAFLRNPERKCDWSAAQDALRIALAYEARERRFARRIGLRVAKRAYEDASDALENLSEQILAAPAQSHVGLGMKGRVVKQWGKPEWWSTDAGHADACERFAARIIDSVIAMAPPP
jgi:multidrug efflux pump subunit AcrA (membrane-fusion protein)